jgi:hypothetical protein
LKPRRQTEVIYLLHHPPTDVADGRLAGLDDFVRKSSTRDHVGASTA